jgi:hypothetical protein
VRRRTLRVAGRSREGTGGDRRAGGPGGHEVARPGHTVHRRLIMRQQRAATIHAGNNRRRRRRRDIQAPREARTPGCGVTAGSALCQCLGGGRVGAVARAHPRVGQGGSRRHRRVATPVRHDVRRRRRRWRRRRRRRWWRAHVCHAAPSTAIARQQHSHTAPHCRTIPLRLWVRRAISELPVGSCCATTHVTRCNEAPGG